MDDLDVHFYYTLYPDLRKAFGYNEQALGEHWVMHGKNEGRIPNGRAYRRALAKFDWEYYAIEHPHVTSKRQALAEWSPNLLRTWVHLDIFSGEEDFESNLARHKKRIPRKYGVNVLGYDGDFGLAQNTASICLALRKAGIPYSRSDVYEINIITYPVDSIPVNVIPLLRDKYNIAIWAWELEITNPSRKGLAKYFDEVWAISQFVSKEVRDGCPSAKVSIVRIPSPPYMKLMNMRVKLGIPENTFVCLTIFDFRSSYHRKNPLAAIRTFREAVGDSKECLLIVKSNGGDSHSSDYRELLDEIRDLPGLLHLDYSMDREEVLSLLNACDVYISLHRAEGSGLTMMEAMALGKPVIATGYSGNLDFMDDDNSLLVGWEYTPVTGCYAKMVPGAQWAEPNVAEATAYLKMLYRNPWLRELYGSRGREKIIKKWTYQRLGQEIMDNLQCFMDQ
jgi:glycosyltransferase involved in cell wall biosynthesis